MEKLIDEIQLFSNTNLKLKPQTLIAYIRHLRNLAKNLAAITNTDLSELHLERIYVVLNSSGDILTYRPIDYLIIDSYLNQNIHRGFSWMRGTIYALRHFFNYLEQKYRFKNVMNQITFDFKEFRKTKKPTRILSRHEILKLLNAIVTYSEQLERDLLLFSLLYSTGCRNSEIRTLRVNQINFKDDCLMLLDTKTNVQRIITLRDGYGEII
ncbi:phage integrase family protein [Paenibacillus prosopidis]|uniref:Phage integrase family protein n=1 Tax=Paenibacillus prosopidis TaxID=630520 RepID=A0A368VUC6_9BACL|nr:phage integrase family protein [Paenibacillus prosopidis]